MLVAEGFEVNVAILPPGEDPDTFVRKEGREAYGQRLKQSRPYLEYLLDRAAMRVNLNTVDGRVQFVEEMKPIVDRIPNRTRQELFVKDVAGRAGVSETVIWKEVRKATTHREAQLSSSQLPGLGQVTKAEKGLIWFLIHDPGRALTALAGLEDRDFEGLPAASVLDLARKLNEDSRFSPSALLERLTMAEANLVTAIASEREPHVHDAEGCARIVRRLRCEREHAAIQREIDRLQRLGAAQHGSEIDALWARKFDLLQRIEGLI
jgi:DNA primase